MMKKPAPKPDSRIKKQERRNFQVGGTKRNSVHPEPGIYPVSNVTGNNRCMTQAEEAARGAREGYEPELTEAEKVAAQKRELEELTGYRPYKLTDSLMAALEHSIAEVPDAPIECHLGCVGITRETYHQWRKRGQEYPETIFGEFAKRIETAMYASWKRLHQMAAKAKPYEVLVRRHGEFYPSEAMRMELTGGAGAALFPDGQTFTVKLELHQGQSDGKPQDEPTFRIVDAETDEAS